VRVSLDQLHFLPTVITAPTLGRATQPLGSEPRRAGHFGRTKRAWQGGSVKSQLQKTKTCVGEFAALGEGHDAGRRPGRASDIDGHRGGPDGRDRLLRTQEQIFYVVGLVIGLMMEVWG